MHFSYRLDTARGTTYPADDGQAGQPAGRRQRRSVTLWDTQPMDFSAQPDNQAFLRQFVENEAELLLKILCAYAVRFGVATPRTASAVAAELLSELVIEALRHADRYDRQRQPMAWLLGIAVNLIKRRRASSARLEQREPLLRDLAGDDADRFSDGELFDRFVALTVGGPAQALEQREQVNALLASLPEDERRLLRLAALHDMNGERLARELGISPGAARVRLHRALKRLRGLLGTGKDFDHA